MEVVMCHGVSHSVSFCLKHVHYKSLVWFKDFGFCCTINTGSLLGLFDNLVVALCHGDPVALDLQDWPLHLFQKFTDQVDVVVGQISRY